VSVLVFDFFGVICSEVAPLLFPKYLPPERAIEVRHSLLHQADLGLITQDEFFARLAGETGAPKATLEAEFLSYARIDHAVVALIEDLRRMHRVALLTNAIVPYVREVLARDDLERLFETILVSAEEHLAKPDPKFYRRLLERMATKPQDATMIDDNPDNITAAGTLGMGGIVFVSATQLAKELAGLPGS
jgi:putative hydrolase of the HAD superfamily